MTLKAELHGWLNLIITELLYIYSRIQLFLGIIKTKYGLIGYFLHKNIPHSALIHTPKRTDAVAVYDRIRDDDVILLTYPKAGTNFAMSIIRDIFQAKGLDSSERSFDDALPSLSGTGSKIAKPTGDILDDLDCASSPRIIGTHFVWSMLPPKVREGKVKVIHCRRNPKDVVCSMYPYIKKIGGVLPETTWNDYVNYYMEGNVIWGGYFDFLKEWYPHRNNPNVLNLQYEDMQKDLEGNVRCIATFLGVELSPEQINKVVVANTFENKKKAMGSLHPIYRKGRSGGWRSELTVEQNEMMDEWIQQEMEGMEDIEVNYC